MVGLEGSLGPSTALVGEITSTDARRDVFQDVYVRRADPIGPLHLRV